MLRPESPWLKGMHLGGKVTPDPAIEHLVPKTSIDHLLSEEERQKAEQERKEFDAVGRRMDMIGREKALYPVFYDSACELMAAGASPYEIQADMMLLADTPDLAFASIVRQAYEDALAARPPRFSATL